MNWTSSGIHHLAILPFRNFSTSSLVTLPPGRPPPPTHPRPSPPLSFPPLPPAPLDPVLGAVGDHHRAVLLDLADVAGGEPVFVEELALPVALHVALHDPRTAHHQVARHAAVLRQVVAGIVDDLHLAAEYRPA